MPAITGQVGAQVRLQDAAGATGNGVNWDVSKYASVVTQNIGTWTNATVTFEGSVDGTTYTAIQGTLISDGSFSTTSTTVDEFRKFDVSGLNKFRARLTWTAGSITVLARAMPMGGGGGGSSPASVDLNEPVSVEGAGADGAAVTGNPVLMAGQDGTNAQTILTSSTGGIATASSVALDDGVTNSSWGRPNAATALTGSRVAGVLFNETTWDRPRGNTDITVLASAARTVETTSATLVNYNARGIMLFFDWTAEAGTSTLTPSIYGIGPVDTGEYLIWTAAAGITAVGNYNYLLYPGALAADFDGTEAAQIALPRNFIVRVAVGTADSNTYSIGASLII